MTRQPPHIVIAGGGVAAVEAVAALRALAGPAPHITLIAPGEELKPRAASVAAPFGFGAPAALSFDAIRRHAPFDLHRGALARVKPDEHVVVTGQDEEISYDKLLVAIGAIPRPAVRGAICFSGPRDVPELTRALEGVTRIAFMVPDAAAWSLPAYELAIMAAVDLRDRGVTPEITVVTAEPAPLWLFGAEASAAVSELLRERRITLRTHSHLAPADAERVIALPRLVGPGIRGLPHDASWFTPTDAHGRVAGLEDVFAAGDATTFPLKQGGLAAQQADAAAEAIAAALGADITPAPFRPVLRGVLMTGGAPLYLRANLGPAGEPMHSGAAVSRRPLWSPPAKVAGRYLAPLLATARPPVLSTAGLQDR